MTTKRNLTLRQMLEGQALYYNPQVKPGLKAIIQFEVSGEEPGVYHLAIQNDTCTFHPHACKGVADLTIKTPSQTWLAIANGELDGQKALMDGKYDVAGDFTLIMLMEKLFDTSIENAYTTTTNTRPGGLIKLKAMTWLSLTFIPWTLFWVLFDVIDLPLVSIGLPLLVALTLLVYQMAVDRPTWLEMGTAAFFVLAAVLGGLRIPWFMTHGALLASVWQGLLWFGSLTFRKLPLCAEYSRYDYQPKMWHNTLFLHPNAIISLFWGCQFLLATALGLVGATLGGAWDIFFMVMRYLLLVPAFIFTAKYPAGSDNRRVPNVDRVMSSFKWWGLLGMLLLAGLTGLMIAL